MPSNKWDEAAVVVRIANTSSGDREILFEGTLKRVIGELARCQPLSVADLRISLPDSVPFTAYQGPQIRRLIDQLLLIQQRAASKANATPQSVYLSRRQRGWRAGES